jgi:hypothetical protein
MTFRGQSRLWRTAVPNIVCVTLLGLCGVNAQPEPFTARIVTEGLQMRLPVDTCDVPAFVLRLARSLRTPAGVEYVPTPCHWRIVPEKDRLSIAGLTVAEALDRITALDETYRWQDLDGVIVVRPVAAWDNRRHFLERKIAKFELDEKNMAEALGALRVTLGEPWVPGSAPLGNRSPEGQKLFSVDLGPASALDILNAVVRIHGALQWELEYCRKGAEPEHAKLWLSTSDGIRIGTHRSALPLCK